jgi:hypothetical protein
VAVSFRVGPHNAWLIAGGTWQCIDGEVVLFSNGTTSFFNVRLPMNAPGYLEFWSSAGAESSSVIVETADGEGPLCAEFLVQRVEFNLVGGVIDVHGEDVMSKLHSSQTFGSWKNQTAGNVVQQIAMQAGVPTSIMGSMVMAGKKVVDDYVKMTDGQTSSAAIMKLAQLEGARYYVGSKDGTLHYEVQTEGGGAAGGFYTLYWQRPAPSEPMVSDCLALMVIHNVAAGTASGITGNSWQPQPKQSVSTGGNGGGGGGGDGGGGGGGPMAGTGYLDQPNMQQAQLKSLADSRFASLSGREWEIRATIAGDPAVEPFMKVSLTGSGFFDRSYDIEKVTHRFGMQGYTTIITSKAKGGATGGK